MEESNKLKRKAIMRRIGDLFEQHAVVDDLEHCTCQICKAVEIEGKKLTEMETQNEDILSSEYINKSILATKTHKDLFLESRKGLSVEEVAQKWGVTKNGLRYWMRANDYKVKWRRK